MQISNNVNLLGHLGKDPVIRTTKKGTKVANTSLATNEYYYDSDGNKKTNTEWHNIVAWGPHAEKFENFLKKGSEILISGKLTSHSYENKDGDKKFITEVKVGQMYILNKKTDQAA